MVATRRSFRPVKGAHLLFSAITAASLLLVVLPGAAASSKQEAAKAADELFAPNQTNVLHIQIEATPEALRKLRGRGWGWGGNRERPSIQVTVREGGHTYTNVDLHLKGSAGSFQPVEAKPGLTLNFGKDAKGQTFHGLQKLSLNNSVQDPSYSSEKICRELFNAAGVPAPRADYASVELNGRKLGLYVLLEGYNRQFLRRYFKNTAGNLYDGGFLRDVDSHLNTNSGDHPEDQSDLRELVEAAQEEDLHRRFERLQQLLDIDRFVRFIAMEVLVCHWDGYALNKNNYRVYHDMDTNRIVFFPHGMDQMLGVMMADATLRIRPQMQGLVARSLMETSEGRRLYYARLSEFNRTLLIPETLTNRIQQWAARVEPVLAQLGPASVQAHRRDVAELCERIAQRKDSLEEQLAGGPGNTPTFDSAGVAPLASWVSTNSYGRPLCKRETQPAGPTLLHIRTDASGIGSWRTKVLLEDGHYIFQARMQTKGVVCDSRDLKAGAGLRAFGRSGTKKQIADSPWTDVSYEFDLPDGVHEVELICELRAAKGDVWFEEDSLKLIRK